MAALDYKWRASIIVGLGLFLSVLDSTIVAVALPAMRHNFATDFNTITWVVSAYFLAQAAIIPITGYISDRAGTKTVYVTAMAVFVVGSVVCTVAPTKEALIAARVLQGLGGGAVFPTSFAIAYRAFPRAEWGRGTAIIGVPVLVAPSLGPISGGYLTTTFSWRAIFLINVPIGLAALVLAVVLLRGRAADADIVSEAREDRIDVPGLVLAVAGFTVLLYGLTEAGVSGWGQRVVMGSLAIAAVILLVLVVFELRTRYPVLDMRIFRHGTVARAIVIIWVATGFYYGSLFLIPFMFEHVQHLSALTSGEIMISQGIAAAVGIAIGGEMYGRFGPRVLGVVGMLSLTLSSIGFMHLGTTTTGLSLQGWLVLRGFGLGLITTPLQNVALATVDRRDLARATSLVNVTRQVSSAAGLAALAAFVAQRAAGLGSAATASLRIGHPDATAAACASQHSVASCVGQHATISALNDAFSIGLVVCGLAVVLAAFVGRDPNPRAFVSSAREPIGEAVPQLDPEVPI